MLLVPYYYIFNVDISCEELWLGALLCAPKNNALQIIIGRFGLVRPYLKYPSLINIQYF